VLYLPAQVIHFFAALRSRTWTCFVVVLVVLRFRDFVSLLSWPPISFLGVGESIYLRGIAG